MAYEIGRIEPMDDWEWDGVLAGLDFAPELECDVCKYLHRHPGVYHVQFSCGCTYFACRETTLLLPFLFSQFRPTCRQCGNIASWVKHGKPL